VTHRLTKALAKGTGQFVSAMWRSSEIRDKGQAVVVTLTIVHDDATCDVHKLRPPLASQGWTLAKFDWSRMGGVHRLPNIWFGYDRSVVSS